MFLKKTPPHSPEAEKTVLGAILVNNKNLNVVLSIIAPEDFYRDAHRKILERIIHLVDRGSPGRALGPERGPAAGRALSMKSAARPIWPRSWTACPKA